MIEYLYGQIASLAPTQAVVDCGGVGYLLNISLSSYDALQGQERAKLLVHEMIREDSHDLYGFATEQERNLFRLLIGVSGVGPNTARTILSAISAPELEMVIVGGDHGRLKTVKGIGLKTAQRIIVDLKDKVKPTEGVVIEASTASTQVMEEALAAMTMLGFPRPAAQKVLKKIIEGEPSITVEAAIKKALALL
ncbi:MAG: Holliday junction branch migration protein RuvA [Bacteroidales bacterium]|nr:Holliday junction branch migration protein RuvA [Bacteroidales bacterium]